MAGISNTGERQPMKAKVKQRSPNYPSLSLSEAVDRVATLYACDGKSGAPIEAVMQHLGYNSESGASRSTISALRKYGLIVDRGGRIAPSDRALDILIYDPNHTRHREALQSAALEPTLYRTLWNEFWDGERLSSDVAMRQHLVRERGFNPNTVGKFLEDFRHTLEYAGLLEGEMGKDQALEAHSSPNEPVEEPGNVGSPTPGSSQGAIPPSNVHSSHSHPPSVPVPTISLLLGTTKDGNPVYAQVTSNQPFTRATLRSLARSLEFMAQQWGVLDEDVEE